jgi:hypothetical protein
LLVIDDLFGLISAIDDHYFAAVFFRVIAEGLRLLEVDAAGVHLDEFDLLGEGGLAEGAVVELDELLVELGDAQQAAQELVSLSSHSNKIIRISNTATANRNTAFILYHLRLQTEVNILSWMLYLLPGGGSLFLAILFAVAL